MFLFTVHPITHPPVILLLLLHLSSRPAYQPAQPSHLSPDPVLECWGIGPVPLGLGPPCRPALFMLDLTTKANLGWREGLYFGFLSEETVSLWIVYTVPVGFGTLNGTGYLLSLVGDPVISALWTIRQTPWAVLYHLYQSQQWWF